VGHSDGLDKLLALDQPPLVIRKKKVRAWPYSFILGADDPEMTEIEKILRSLGKKFRYAMHEGSRVHPGNAYKADPITLKRKTIAVLVECEPKDFLGSNAMVRIIDHHRPGDPGFNLSHKLFWEASSIGQIYKLLDLGTPPQEHLTLAALDHCMVHARRGNCPGVDPEMLKLVSRQHIAIRKKVGQKEVESCIHEMREVITASPVILMGEQEVSDITNVPLGVGYSLEYLCTQEALADLHKAALIRTKNKAAHPDKVLICGASTKETIKFFMEVWAIDNGLIDIYGVPERGYAGGYRG
jgi:hypothetical protein